MQEFFYWLSDLSTGFFVVVTLLLVGGLAVLFISLFYRTDDSDDRKLVLKRRPVVAGIYVIAALALCIFVAIGIKPTAKSLYKQAEMADKQAILAEFETFILDHREELEIEAHEQYATLLAERKEFERTTLATWLRYKDSKEDALFDQAVDAWNVIAEHIGYAEDQQVYFRLFRSTKLSDDSSFSVSSYYPAFYYKDLPITRQNTGKTVDENIMYILWDGRAMPPDLPETIPAIPNFPEEEDFPQYAGSPRAIEDKAKELFDRFRRTREDTTDLLKAAMLYNDHVTKNAEVLERRGFFIDYPVELKTLGYE